MSIDGAELNRATRAFIAKPDAMNVPAVVNELATMSQGEAQESLKRIARTLAGRTAAERSTITRLITSQLSLDLSRAFLKITAGVRLSHSTVEIPQTSLPPPHDRVLEHLDLVEPKQLKPLKATTPGGRDRLGLEALDLAAAGKVGVDLVALEKRIDDADDASSMGHLIEALDQVNKINGRAGTYSETRRATLASLVKGTTQEHLVEQMGFRAAKSQRRDTGLSTQNELAASYWRTNFRDTLKLFLSKLMSSGKPGPKDLLVNSPRVLRKLEMIVPTEVLKDLEITPLVGNTGISVLSGTEKHSDIDWNSILQELGATPSAYQLYELMDMGKTPPPKDRTVDAWADLGELITSSPFSRLQEIARSTGELAPVCTMIEHLVLGLTDELGPERRDPLTANALSALGELLDIVVADEHNPSVAMRAVDLMMDEIGLVVVTSRNYNWSDYRQTMRKVLLERAPSLVPLVDKEIEIGGHLMTSGMDALGTALAIALWTRGQDQVSRVSEGIDYYETSLLLAKLKRGEVVIPREDVVIAALNPSTPFEAPRVDGLVVNVKKRLDAYKPGDAPFALLLDTTIELDAKSLGGRAQLDVLFGELKEDIAAGKLEVFLCKSFQKYASFGTGKVAAGDLTLLSRKGNLASASARAEVLLHDIDLDLARHDEAQLVLHMLRHGHRDEFTLMRSAASNAQFVDKFCWPIDPGRKAQGSTYVDGIPLLMRSTPAGDVDKVFKKLLIDQRDSFSFLRTSYVGGINLTGTPEFGARYVRINTGHESKETMVEYFYAFGHLVSDTLPGGKGPSGASITLSPLPLDAVSAHLDALAKIQDAQDDDIRRYRPNIQASYLAFALQNLSPKKQVRPLLTDFFAKPVGHVSIETLRYLAGELLALAKTSADTADLPALVRAAELLPSWWFKPIATGFNLDSVGDSELAGWLRTLVQRATVA